MDAPLPTFIEIKTIEYFSLSEGMPQFLGVRKKFSQYDKRTFFVMVFQIAILTVKSEGEGSTGRKK